MASPGEAKSRRRWSAEAKRRIVAQSYEPGMSVAKLARRYELNDNQIFNWRRALRGSGMALSSPAGSESVSFAVVDVVADAQAAGAGQMEIELPSGARVRVGGDVSEPALVRVLRALKVAL